MIIKKEDKQQKEVEIAYNRIVKLLNLLRKKEIITEEEYTEVYDVK